MFLYLDYYCLEVEVQLYMSSGVLSKYLHSSSIFYPLLLVSCSSVFSPGLHSELSSPSPSAPAPRRHWLSLFELRTASSAAYTRNMKANILSTVLSRFSKITKSVIFIPEISLLASSTIFFCSVSGAWSFAVIAVTLFSVAVSLVLILKHHRRWDFQWKAWAVSCTRLCLLVEISEIFLNWE